MSKVLITGGAGFIGFHLAKKLSVDSSNTICIADNLKRGRTDEDFNQLLLKPNVEFCNVDLTNVDSMKKIWNNYDEVYHLAAIVGVKHCTKDPAGVLNSNIKSTMNIIQLVIENQCKKLVFSSTSETYSGGFELGIVKIPTNETVPLCIVDIKNPRFSYAVSKIAGEQLVIFNSQDKYKFSIVRYHNIFGPRMGYAHVIPEILKRIYQKEMPFKIYGFDQTRSFCYVEDAVSQTISCMESNAADGEIIHIGNNQEEIMIKDLVKKIFDLVNYNVDTLEMPAPLGSVTRRCPDISKLVSLTSAYPAITLDEGLKKTVEWYWKQLEGGNIWE
jgi:UDP-glucose 4-epimerase